MRINALSLNPVNKLLDLGHVDAGVGVITLPVGVIALPEWEITRGILQTYDAYAALIAHNPDWATVPAVPATPASIATQAWTVPDGFLGYHADDDTAAAALPQVANTIQGTFTHGDGNFLKGNSTDIIVILNTAAIYQQVRDNISAGDAITVVQGENTFNYLVSSVQYSANAVTFYVDADTAIISGDASVDITFTYSDDVDATYYNTTDNEFRKTENGVAWQATTIQDALLANSATAFLLTGVLTSAQARALLDTLATFNPTHTYYFYNGTEIRRVSSFTASVDAVDAIVKLTNYVLDADTVPLAFDIAGLLGGNVPVTVTDLPHVDFTVDVEGTERRFRIPVTLVALPLQTPAGLSIEPILFDTATLIWAPPLNAERFRVAYRVGTGPWQGETTVTTTAHTFTGLSPNTAYEFRVIAEADGYSDSDAATVTGTTLNDQLTTTWSFTQGDNALLNLAPLLGTLGPATDLQLAADTPAQFSVEGLGIRERTGGAFVEEELATDDFVISSILQAFGVTQDNLDYVGVTSSPTSEVTETVGKAYYDHFVDLRLFVFIIETSPGDPDTISAYQVQPADALRSYGSGTVVWLGHRSQMEVATYNENTFNANDTYYYFNTSVNAICRIVSYSPATVPNVSQIVATATIAETTVTVTIDLTIMVSTLSAVTNITRRVVFRLVRIAWDGVAGANNYRIQYRRRTQTDPEIWEDWQEIVVAHIGAGVNHIRSFTVPAGGHHEFRIWTEAEGLPSAVSETLTFTTFQAFGGSDDALNVPSIGQDFILIGNELILMER